MWNLISGSKLCQERELQREHFQHHVKLLHMKARVDNKPPRPMSHLENKARRIRMEQDKNESIRKDNQLLLKKMIEIDQKPSFAAPPRTRKLPTSASLNRRVRIQELTKISRENKSLLQRLQRTQSVYSVKRWQEESDYKEYLRECLSRNAGRVPKAWNYDLDSYEQASFSRNTWSRPLTAMGREESGRPKTAEGRGRTKAFL